MSTVCRIRVAGRVFLIRARSENLPGLYRKYIAEEDAVPDFSVEIADEELDAERQAMEEYASVSARAKRDLPLKIVENAAIFRKVAACLLPDGTVPLHGSAIAWKGHGILFTAPSGTGKSTHTRFWKALYGDEVTVVNDDKPLICTDQSGRCLICGSPWSGSSRTNENITVPLHAVCFLHRAEENRFREADRAEALSGLLQCIYRPGTRQEANRVVNAVRRINACASFFEVGCVNDISAASFVRERIGAALKE